MAPHPVRADNGNGHMTTHSTGSYRVVTQETRTSSGGAMSSLMCCTSTRSQKVMGMHKESQKKFLWLDPNRWSGQKTVKKEKVNTHTPDSYLR